jgi:feruloyl esterase
MKRVLATIILGLATLVGATFANAQPAPDPAAARCDTLAKANLAGIPEAATRILFTQFVPAAGTIPAYCHAEGVVGGTVNFMINLPEANWNGKFIHAGGQYSHISVSCSGPQCALTIAECDGPVERGYACIVDDEGHKAAEPDFSWAYQNPQAKIDFAFRATHISTVAGKAITASYYGKAPARSYFLGCSLAGRQAMVEAQKFPNDYDGIVAGAAPLRLAENLLTLAWAAAAHLGADGKSIFPVTDGKRWLQPDLYVVRDWYAEKCKKQAGVDGVLQDPRVCHPDPSELQCKGPKTATCLTAEQVAAVKKIYGGPVNSKGESLSDMRTPAGSEGNWGALYMNFEGDSAYAQELLNSVFKYLDVSGDNAPRATMFDWDNDYKRIALQSAFFDAVNSDLRPFKAHGGKLISFAGWTDDEALPQNMIDYYESVMKTMGGAATTKDFFRLFMVPAMDHCANGGSTDKTDYLGALEQWVENGKAPDVLIALQRLRPDNGKYNIWPAQSQYWWGHPFPKEGTSGWSRPIYPYPTLTKYKGSGNQDDAANWEPVQPKP